MTVPIQNLRSGTASKRPVATGLAVGQIAVNYNEADPAIYLRGDADALVKVSPTFIGSSAPNATPSGSSGNSKGETWLDTSTTPPTLKIWTGAAWNANYTLPGTSVLLSGVTGSTPAVGDSSTLLATTSFVNAEIANDAPTKTGGGASGTWNISISGDAGGNASTATALQTARTISLGGDLSGSASFDGTGNITITSTIGANSVALGTDTTGNYVASGSTSGNGISGSSSSEGGTFTVTSNATDANTGSTIVFRDASGNFSAGTISAALNGNASTASALATARTIALSGDVTGSASFNGGSNITITATVADDSHNHTISNVDGLQTALDAKAPLASPSLTGTVTIANLDITGRIKEDATSTTTSIDCSTGNYFYITINSNSTFTFGSVPSGAYGFVLEVTHTSGTITWPASVKWPADTAPTLTTGKTHLFVFVTDDGGTRWRGASLVDYVN